MRGVGRGVAVSKGAGDMGVGAGGRHVRRPLFHPSPNPVLLLLSLYSFFFSCYVSCSTCPAFVFPFTFLHPVTWTLFLNLFQFMFNLPNTTLGVCLSPFKTQQGAGCLFAGEV